MMKLNYQWKNLQELTSEEMFTLFQLRQEIFVVEQDCVYLDMDEIDRGSFHLLGQEPNDERVYATLRVFASENDIWHIGRVATSVMARKQGVARKMMEEALTFLQKKSVKVVEISAQEYLLKFYESLGFKKSSDVYMLDGLPHIDMLLHF
ncbi:GNAT family N-acetyltransferase [Halosquirtibacter xylanolyticus]|uniref:GNAT family N-acetyltransferase n=1 Tax=Halosquirtibacter xylanolyticus TaxID=3374599 RepID=UPI0037493449|nr:GNAT family N-acetyltransferase [Prolixibacteraceae bacterium]